MIDIRLNNSLFFSLSIRSILSFEGSMTNNFTATKDLFSSSRDVLRWRFEVIYSFSRVTSSLNFEISSPRMNVSCSISPTIGRTSTPFFVSCPSWFDEDQIKDDSLSLVSSRRPFIAFSLDPIFRVCLPAHLDSSQLLIVIRDQTDSLTEWKNLWSIVVQPDRKVSEHFLKMIKGEWTSNPFMQFFNNENPNEVEQAISSLIQQINQLDQDNHQQAVSTHFFFFFVSSFLRFRQNSSLNHFGFLVRFFNHRGEFNLFFFVLRDISQ